MAACTSPPWQALIPFEERPDALRRIREECLSEYGYEFEECSKRLRCDKKQCIGRPLPWKSKTAKPYLDELSKTQKIVNEEMVIITDCQTCPIFKKCTSTCNQIDDYIDRKVKPEPVMYYRNDVSNSTIESEGSAFFKDISAPIHWHLISTLYKNALQDYILKDLNLNELAVKYNTDRATIKSYVYSAITTLSKYRAIAKSFNSGIFRSDLQKTCIKQLLDSNTIKELAAQFNVTNSAIRLHIQNFTQDNKITWKKYVHREKGGGFKYHKDLRLKDSE